MASVSTSIDFLDSAERDDELGRLGPYRVKEELGKGGMGQVFRAEDSRLKRVVALKVMNKKFAATSGSRKRFVDEARSMAAVHHDNVATIFEVGQHNGNPFLAMELLQGESLESAIQSGRQWSVAEVMTLARQVALGLAAAHGRGIVHRDIKPANLWLQNSLADDSVGRVKILDFGLALAGTAVDRLADVGSVVGSPGYLSPEQARNEPLDARTDLYSLGVVLYQLLSGRVPLLAKTIQAQLVKIIAHPPQPIRSVRGDVPKPFAELVDRLLCKEARDRVQTASDLVLEIERAEIQIEDDTSSQVNIVVQDEDSGVRMAGRRRSKTDSETKKNDSPTKSVKTKRSTLPLIGIGCGVVAMAAGMGFYLMGPAIEPQARRRVNVPTHDMLVKPEVTAAALDVLALDEKVVGQQEVKQGEVARYRVLIKNLAVDPSADPRTQFADQNDIAQIHTFVKPNGGPREAAPTFPIKIDGSSLPALGKSKSFDLQFATDSLGVEPVNVVFELQTRQGDVIGTAESKLFVAEDLMRSDLLGFDSVRTADGRGADTNISYGKDFNLGQKQELWVHQFGKGQGKQQSHSYLRFDLKRLLPPDQEKMNLTRLDRAVLSLTVSPRGHQGNTEVAVFGWSAEESDGKTVAANSWGETNQDSLIWDNAPTKDNTDSLVPLGTLVFDNGGDALAWKTDEVRFVSTRLDDFLRKQTSDTVTLVLTRKNWAKPPTKFRSRDAKAEQAPRLSVRWKP